MKYNTPFFLSLQKQFANKKTIVDSEINRAFNELHFKTMLNRCGITKNRGYSTNSLLFLIVLVPFLKRKLNDFWNSEYFQNQVNARKDAFYRFLNYERFNWRKIVYLIAVKIIAAFDDNTPLREKVLIVDDSIVPKTGKDMELVSYHFDHKAGRSVLSNQCLQLGYHDGINFFPLDMAFNTSSKRPNNKLRNIDKRTIGWRRRKEAMSKKTDILIQMVDRAWKEGIDAAFLLFDSWFAHDDVISKIYDIGYGVVCRLKKNRVRYQYQGASYTLKQLWQHFAKKKTSNISAFSVKGVCLNVALPKTGAVRILFISDGKKEWSALLTTDLELTPSEILEYYTRRWAIEVFFKDAKQMLCMGKEQSRTFDAVIASHSIVMIRYLLLVYITRKRKLSGPLGPLFRELSDSHVLLSVAKKFWAYVKDQIIQSSNIVLHKFEPDLIAHLIENIENNLFKQADLLTAKL